MKRFTYTSYPSKLSSIYAVKKAMDDLQNELHQTDMHNLQAFNQTYRIITQRVIEKLNTGYFTDDSLLQRIDIEFAWYYFRALKDYVSKKPIAPAWEILFTRCQTNELYQFGYMALGVNAHVNHDLPLTLRTVHVPTSARRDFDLINPLLQERIHTVFTTLTEDSHRVNHAKNLLIPTYRPLLTRLIKHWRNTAWLHYRQLESKAMTEKQISQHAGKIARRIAHFKKATRVLRVDYLSRYR
jgi:hypothetical protein